MSSKFPIHLPTESEWYLFAFFPDSTTRYMCTKRIHCNIGEIQMPPAVIENWKQDQPEINSNLCGLYILKVRETESLPVITVVAVKFSIYLSDY